MDKDTKKSKQAINLNINLDTTPILYTDSIFMTTNPDGLVFDVVQRIGFTDQARIVARIGMSREHAKKLVDKLGNLILRTEGRAETGKKTILN